MIFRDFQDLRISNLGFGAMRLPTLGGEDGAIDEAAVFRMVDTAMANGVNYYDTAWGYHGGASENVLGRALARYPRGGFYLADKFPGYDRECLGRTREIFEKQLEKCGVEYFDFYLFHNVYEANVDAYLDDAKYHTFTDLLALKKEGRIRHLGFSAHGSTEVIRRFLDAYGGEMEFCQIQLNWLDWELQDAKAKAALLNERRIPIWVMEPLRGGRLASLAEQDAARLAALRPDEGIPAWSFRFLQGVPGVTVILSGMSDERQLAENIRTFETDRPLNEAEKAALFSVAGGMTRANSLPCTGCRYCVDYCPMGLNIPWLLKLYNERQFAGGGYLMTTALRAQPDDKKPSACLGCGSCEQVCPQQIRISEAMASLAEEL